MCVLSHAWLFATPWTIPCQAPLSSNVLSYQQYLILSAILEWVATSSSRGSSWPRDRTQVSCMECRCFHPPSHQGKWKSESHSVVSDFLWPHEYTVHGLLQARILEWVVSLLSCVPRSATPWTVAHQAPLSMEFSRQEYWSGLPFPFPTGMGSHSLLQELFPAQGLNPGLLHCRQILYQVSHQGGRAT